MDWVQQNHEAAENAVMRVMPGTSVYKARIETLAMWGALIGALRAAPESPAEPPSVEGLLRDLEHFSRANRYIGRRATADLMDRAAAAIRAAQAPESGGWQPMDKAPLDGTPVLLAIHDCGDPSLPLHFAVAHWKEDGDWHRGDDEYDTTWPPVMWQAIHAPRLPELP